MKPHTSFLVILILVLASLAPAAQGTPAAQKVPAKGQKAAAPAAQPAFDLSIDNIMRGSNLYGYEPRLVRWSPDSQKLYFEWKQATDSREKNWDTWVVNRDGSGLRKLSEEEVRNLPAGLAGGGGGGFGGGGMRGGGGGGLERSKDKKWTLLAENGDIVLLDPATGKKRPLTQTTDTESNPRFTRDQRHVTFLRSGNLYMLSLDSGELEQLTDIRTPAAAAAAPATPPAGAMGGFGQGQGRGGAAAASAATAGQQTTSASQEFLKNQEKELLDIIKRRAAKREEDAATRKKEQAQAQPERLPLTLQSRQNLGGLQLTPDGKYVTASLGEPAEGAKSSIVPSYVTESAYVEDISGRSLVGDNQSRSWLVVLNVKTGELKYVETGLKPTTEPAAAKSASTETPDAGGAEQAGEAVNEGPDTETLTDPSQAQRGQGGRAQQGVGQQGAAGQAGAGRRAPTAPAERELRLSSPVWNEEGTRAVLMANSADFKDRWIMALDPETAKTRILVADHDDAWIGGPGAGTLGWMKDDRTIYFVSERTGYAQLYTISYDGGQPRPLTSGKWEVQGTRLSEDKTKFYLTTNEGSPFETHYYSMPAEGGPRTKITSMAGRHSVTQSPDEKWLAEIYSFSNRPPELYLVENRPGAEAAKVTTSPLPEFSNYPWIDPPIVQIPARDGVLVPSRMFKPKNWKPGGPGVIFVHGSGYAQDVMKWWSSNPQVYLFCHFLMEHGYLVLSVDYRGSAGYGRDWRTAIYRHMGGKDLEDEVDAAKWMVQEQGADPRRVGIWGGSYGGFMTLMAMFTAPDVFAAGAALRPVTDWSHYNHGYTGEILNLPQKDAEAYKRSSPIYFAEGLKGALLICHGVVDTNVFFQDTVRLVQRLIELKKENWEAAMYPVEDHSFVEPTSWSDEYKRIFKLFEANLKKPLPALPRAKQTAQR